MITVPDSVSNIISPAAVFLALCVSVGFLISRLEPSSFSPVILSFWYIIDVLRSINSSNFADITNLHTPETFLMIDWSMHDSW